MNQTYYKEYYTLERSHWWFLARLKIIKSQISTKIMPNLSKKVSILNVGVATGATSQMLENFGEVTSLEYDKDCCKFLEETVGLEVINGSLTELPFADNSFDMICAFDVIEHIEDDEKALEEIERVLKPNGYYFITVPAFNFLWSKHDDVNHHIRRYTLKELQQKLDANQLTSKYKSYFNFWMFLPIAMVRLLQRLIPRKEKENFSGSDSEVMSSSSFLNNILYRLFLSENMFLKNGISFPFGISIYTIGSAKNTAL